MIDHLSINIPFSKNYLTVTSDGKFAKVNVDLLDFDLKLACRAVHKDEDGNIKPEILYHPYESIPTHFTGMSLKVNFESIIISETSQVAPFVNIKASPAKILQGHNVFGSDDLESGVMEMFGWLATAYPDLYKLLDVQNATISHIDITYSARAESEEQAKQVLEFLRTVSAGQTKLSKKQEDNTVYWGGVTSRLINIKCYLKHEEFLAQYQDMYKKAQANNLGAKRVLEVMQNQDLINYTVGLIRLETRLKNRWLQRKKIPLNIWDLIRYQKQNPHIMRSLWTVATESLLGALRGQSVYHYYDDEAIINQIKQSDIVLNNKGKLAQQG